MRIVWLALLLASIGCSGGVDSRPSADDCRRMHDHVIELRLASLGKGLPPAEVEKHRAALRAASGQAQVDDCRSQRRPAELSCILTAADLDSARACSAAPAMED